MTTAADDKGGRQQWHARLGDGLRGEKKEESGRQTTTALDKRLISPLGREGEKTNNLSLHEKTFFSNTVCPVGIFAPAKTANVPF
jgi:hypothetical protein